MAFGLALAHICIVYRGDGGIVDGKHQSLVGRRQAVQIVSRCLDELVNGGRVEDLDYGINIFLV